MLYEVITKKTGFNEAINLFVREVQYHQHISPRYLPDKEIRERLLYRMVNEAMKCMEEQLVASETLLDLAFIYGTGFPASTGGPLLV